MPSPTFAEEVLQRVRDWADIELGEMLHRPVAAIHRTGIFDSPSWPEIESYLSSRLDTVWLQMEAAAPTDTLARTLLIVGTDSPDAGVAGRRVKTVRYLHAREWTGVRAARSLSAFVEVHGQLPPALFPHQMPGGLLDRLEIDPARQLTLPELALVGLATLKTLAFSTTEESATNPPIPAAVLKVADALLPYEFGQPIPERSLGMRL